MSVAPLFPEKPVKIVVPTGVSCRAETPECREEGKRKGEKKIKPKSQQLQQPPCEYNNGRELMHTSHYCCHASPLVYNKDIKKEQHQKKGKTLQSAADQSLARAHASAAAAAAD